VKRGNAGGPRVASALLLQLGPDNNHILFRDPTVTHALAHDTHTTKTIVAIRKSTMAANLFDKLTTQPKAFHDYVMNALGEANFCDDSKLRPLRARDIQWGDEDTQEVRGFAMMRNGKKKSAFHRSGTHGVYLRTAERDDSLTVVNLPIKTTLAEGNIIHKKLPAGLSEGLVTTARGFAIRCDPANKAHVEQLIRPNEAEVYGKLFNLQKEDASQYIVRGVDSEVTGPMLHASLDACIRWKVKPLKPLRSAAWGKRDWIVWAIQSDKPITSFISLTTAAGALMRCEISEHPFTKRTSFWQDVAEGIAEGAEDTHRDMDYDDNDNQDDDNEDCSGSGWKHYTPIQWAQWHNASKCRNWYDMSSGGDEGLGDMDVDQPTSMLEETTEEADVVLETGFFHEPEATAEAEEEVPTYPWTDGHTDVEDKWKLQQAIDEATAAEKARLDAAAAHAVAATTQLLQQQEVANAATVAATATAAAAQQQLFQQQQVATEAGTRNSTIIETMRLEQEAQVARANALAASIETNVKDVATLMGMFQTQANTLNTLSTSVTALSSNVALLLAKVSEIAEGKPTITNAPTPAAATVTATAAATDAEAAAAATPAPPVAAPTAAAAAEPAAEPPIDRNEKRPPAREPTEDERPPKSWAVAPTE
jgi:hypothetical protein